MMGLVKGGHIRSLPFPFLPSRPMLTSQDINPKIVAALRQYIRNHIRYIVNHGTKGIGMSDESLAWSSGHKNYSAPTKSGIKAAMRQAFVACGWEYESSSMEGRRFSMSFKPSVTAVLEAMGQLRLPGF